MPLHPGGRARILANLRTLAEGGRAVLAVVGEFTAQQLADLNAVRRGLGLHEIVEREIVFIGRHLHASRSRDGYSLEDMAAQIESALATTSIVFASRSMTTMENPQARDDGYGNRVHDRAVFECTARRPRAELFSVIPKGDDLKPTTRKGPPEAGPSGGDPG